MRSVSRVERPRLERTIGAPYVAPSTKTSPKTKLRRRALHRPILEFNRMGLRNLRRPWAARLPRGRALALGVLGGFASALEAWLLPFLHARIARQHAVLLQHGPHREVGDAQGARDAVLHGAGLPGHAAAIDHCADVEALAALGQLERLDHDHLEHPPTEVLQWGLVIDHDGPLARIEADPRDRVLAPSGAVIVGGVIGQ